MDQAASFEEYTHQIVTPIHAAPWRKHRIREELLAHVWASYQDQRNSRDLSDRSAANAVMQRLGDMDSLREQLQASVPPIEQLFFSYLDRKETFMSVILWILGCVAAIIGINLVFPAYGGLITIGAFALVGIWTFIRLGQGHNAVSQWLRFWRLCLLGIAGALVGMAVILPALAKMKQGVFPPTIVVALLLGILLTLEGLALIGVGIRRRLSST